MKARVEALLRRLGAAGVLGVGVLLAVTGFWLSEVRMLEEEIKTRQAAAERMRARTPYRPVSNDSRVEELRRFQELFPSSRDLTGETEKLHQLGRRAGLELAQGEYRLEKPAAGLWAYRVTLPVAGSYPQLRDFIAAVLKGMPAASIDALRFERKRFADAQLEAQVRLTLHVRPSGDSP